MCVCGNGLFEIFHSVFVTVSEGFPIIGPFLKKPSEQAFPDYYIFIKTPMDMETINENIKSNNYKTLDDFSADVNLMLENCKTYNEPTSLLFKDACKLQKFLKSEMSKIQPNQVR